MAGALSRMPVEKSVVVSGLVKPQFSRGSMAVAEKGDLERYLELEPAPELVLFRARLGLTVIDLAAVSSNPMPRRPPAWSRGAALQQ